MTHGRARQSESSWSRRDVLRTLGTAAGAVAAGTSVARAAQGAPQAPTVISNPPRDFGPNAPPNVYFNDPDVLTVDPSFGGYIQPNAPIMRLWTGALWTE